MSIYQDLLNGNTKLSLVGLGYVGMPIAVEFAKHVKVIGFDINERKIAQYRAGLDPTKEVGDDAVSQSSVAFTSDATALEEARFHIVAVPTPVNQDKTPDLTPVIGASETLGKHLKPGSIVVYESTVYPGVTEDVCVPILERESGLTCGIDFKVGYSPERINPGDKVHTLTTIRKIVSGQDAESLEEIKNVYDIVIAAGTYPVSTIKTAEAVKVVENSQRDINIAFMNELAMVFDRMGIDTSEVVEGMNTKWNALGFKPGLVGGHCIGVDPYYFTYEAEKLGYHSQIILSGRKVNDGMGEFVPTRPFARWSKQVWPRPKRRSVCLVSPSKRIVPTCAILRSKTSSSASRSTVSNPWFAILGRMRLMLSALTGSTSSRWRRCTISTRL